LFGSLREHLRKNIPIIELDCAINDPSFAEACARELLALMGKDVSAKTRSNSSGSL
jgi:hypothetical protein